MRLFSWLRTLTTPTRRNRGLRRQLRLECLEERLCPSSATLDFSTFLGGSGGAGADRALAVAVDSAGNSYVTGYTSSADFPVTSGAFQTLALRARLFKITNQARRRRALSVAFIISVRRRRKPNWSVLIADVFLMSLSIYGGARRPSANMFRSNFPRNAASYSTFRLALPMDLSPSRIMSS